MGHDVLTSHEAGKANQRIPDEEVLAFAAQSGRILLTLNRWDFIILHAKSNQHAGIMVCTQNPDLLQQAEQIDKAVAEAGNMKEILIRVNRG
jgi:predicted nuclease of predicted toxin-antitoxin system